MALETASELAVGTLHERVGGGRCCLIKKRLALSHLRGRQGGSRNGLGLSGDALVACAGVRRDEGYGVCRVSDWRVCRRRGRGGPVGRDFPQRGGLLRRAKRVAVEHQHSGARSKRRNERKTRGAKDMMCERRDVRGAKDARSEGDEALQIPGRGAKRRPTMSRTALSLRLASLLALSLTCCPDSILSLFTLRASISFSTSICSCCCRMMALSSAESLLFETGLE